MIHIIIDDDTTAPAKGLVIDNFDTQQDTQLYLMDTQCIFGGLLDECLAVPEPATSLCEAKGADWASGQLVPLPGGDLFPILREAEAAPAICLVSGKHASCTL